MIGDQRSGYSFSGGNLVVRKLAPTVRRSVRVQVRFARPDLRLIEALARREGIPRSEWMRRELAAAVARITQVATAPGPAA